MKLNFLWRLTKISIYKMARYTVNEESMRQLEELTYLSGQTLTFHNSENNSHGYIPKFSGQTELINSNIYCTDTLMWINHINGITTSLFIGADDNSKIELKNHGEVFIIPYSGATTGGADGRISLGNKTDRSQFVNFVAGSVTTAPSSTTAGTVTNRYGGATTFLGAPTGWLVVLINGTLRKIPYY